MKHPLHIFRTYIVLIGLLSLFASQISEAYVPKSKNREQVGSIDIKGNKLGVLFESNIVDRDSVTQIISLSLNMQIINSKLQTDQITSDFALLFCDTGHLCFKNKNAQVQTAMRKLASLKNGFAIIPVNKSESPLGIATIVVVSQTNAGFHHGLYTILDDLKMDSKGKPTRLSLYKILDYADMHERAVFMTAAQNQQNIDNWKNVIDQLVSMRYTHLLIQVSGSKVFFDVPGYSEITNKEHAFFSTDMVRKIIEHGKKRGLIVVPTLIHMTNLELGKIHPDWTMPNGRAIDWRKKESQKFQNQLIYAFMKKFRADEVSIWTDEGGILAVQDDYLDNLGRSYLNATKSLGILPRLRVLTTRTIYQAMDSGVIDDLPGIVPQASVFDYWDDLGTPDQPGTYDLDRVAFRTVFLRQMKKRGQAFTITPALSRSAWNKMPVPLTSYLAKVVHTAHAAGSEGLMAYNGEGKIAGKEIGFAALADFTWNALNFDERDFLKRWLKHNNINENAVDAYLLFEKAATKTALAMFQQFRARNAIKILKKHEQDNQLDESIDSLTSALSELEKAAGISRKLGADTLTLEITLFQHVTRLALNIKRIVEYKKLSPAMRESKRDNIEKILSDIKNEFEVMRLPWDQWRRKAEIEKPRMPLSDFQNLSKQMRKSLGLNAVTQ